MRQEKWVELCELFEGWSERDRAILAARGLCAMGPEDTAEYVGVSRRTVERVLERAREEVLRHGI